uniref:10 kDa heat shock protein, mitochondrial n=1 Tax=Bionectria ochroleuca TaxID=29856 RepID=A0A8H7NNB0_BIOOC
MVRANYSTIPTNSSLRPGAGRRVSQVSPAGVSSAIFCFTLYDDKRRHLHPIHPRPRPLLDRVLVQRVKAETKTASGIFLPESSVEKLNEAKVLAVGPGLLDKKGNRLPMGVAVGDRVLIPQFGGSPVKAGEEEYQLFRDSEILAKINE